jgi:hypothetical protein
MNSLLLQVIFPFALSAVIIILITIIAERYGTKTGGILGTLPSTIIVAFIFISLNKGVYFASQSAAVVPAEMGVNLIFLFIFASLSYRSMSLAIIASLTVWLFLTSMLFLLGLENIFVSIAIYTAALVFTFMILERIKKTPSIGSVTVHYTPLKIILRGLLAGSVIAIAVFLSNMGAILSGIFSVFPAIFLSTMLISLREHGPNFAGGIAKSMIFGSQSVMIYAVAIYFFYPLYGVVLGSIFAFCISIIVMMILLGLRKKIK